MTTIDDAPCVVRYQLLEKDGGTEFDLIISDAIAGSKLHKEMLGAQGDILKNLKAIAKTGKPAVAGRMVTLLSPVIAIYSKIQQRIENWPL